MILALHVFFTLSLFPTLLCLVLGWQEHRKAPLLNVYCVLTRTHTQTHKTHPHWNKHNPPAPLSWVTLLKQNNNDRVQGGDLCVCVCVLSWRTHRHANSIESPPCWSLIVWVRDGGQNWTRGGAVSTEKNSSEVLLDSVKSCDNAFPM